MAYNKILFKLESTNTTLHKHDIKIYIKKDISMEWLKEMPIVNF